MKNSNSLRSSKNIYLVASLLFALVFTIPSCMEESTEIGQKTPLEREITLENEGSWVMISVTTDSEASYKKYDKDAFALNLLKVNLENEQAHEHEDIAFTLNETLVNRLTSELPTVKVIDSNIEDEHSYEIEFVNLDFVLPNLESDNSRACYGTNPLCVIHFGCNTIKYRSTCGGYYYSRCNYQSPYHWHPN